MSVRARARARMCEDATRERAWVRERVYGRPKSPKLGSGWTHNSNPTSGRLKVDSRRRERIKVEILI